MSGKRISPEDTAQRHAAYEYGMAHGMTLFDIARRLGICGHRYREWVQRNIKGISSKSPPKPTLVIKAERPCLTCKAPMQSTGPHHRLCNPCRERASRGYSPYTPNPGGNAGRRVMARGST